MKTIKHKPIQAIGIGGMPASGKTTLVKNIRKKLKKPKMFRFGVLRGEYYTDENLYILGVYGKGLFDGTDKLSMSVQPDAVSFFKKISETTVLFEGDRLFNLSFIEAIRNLTELKLYYLDVKDTTLAVRHFDRNDTQTDKFKKGRKTKYENILNNCSDIVVLNNQTEKDLNQNIETIWHDLEKK
tara:strand:+ start:1979 stop:2530 length:552 start_codon:yes stop_codon:yes gene_type:complete